VKEKSGKEDIKNPNQKILKRIIGKSGENGSFYTGQSLSQDIGIVRNRSLIFPEDGSSIHS
jgi:hypothetical protein